jgi:hypothetical protein
MAENGKGNPATLLSMRVLLSFLLVAQAPFWDASAADCLKIGVASGGLSSAAVARIADRIFSLAGSCAEIVSMPSNRLTQLTESDGLDGEALKITDYIQQHPNLVEVPTAVMHLTGNLYWPAETAEPLGSSATIGVLLGQIWPKRAVQERGSVFFEVRGYDQMIEMTHSGRLQGFMVAAEAFELLRQRYDYLANYKSTGVADIPLYLALNRRNADLIPALDKTIRKMQESGEIDREIKAEDR